MRQVQSRYKNANLDQQQSLRNYFSHHCTLSIIVSAAKSSSCLSIRRRRISPSRLLCCFERLPHQLHSTRPGLSLRLTVAVAALRSTTSLFLALEPSSGTGPDLTTLLPIFEDGSMSSPALSPVSSSSNAGQSPFQERLNSSSIPCRLIPGRYTDNTPDFCRNRIGRMPTYQVVSDRRGSLSSPCCPATRSQSAPPDDLTPSTRCPPLIPSFRRPHRLELHRCHRRPARCGTFLVRRTICQQRARGRRGTRATNVWRVAAAQWSAGGTPSATTAASLRCCHQLEQHMTTRTMRSPIPSFDRTTDKLGPRWTIWLDCR